MGCGTSKGVKPIEMDNNAKERQVNQQLHLNYVHEEYLRDINEFYEIIPNKILGRGLSGPVRLCVHKETKIEFALKMLKKSKNMTDEILDRFRQELKIMASLDHPNIIKLFETFESKDSIYLIIELCRGGELMDRLYAQNNQRFGEYTSCKFIYKILLAVRYCHERNIAHRDLKLENVLFTSDSSEAELKLIDFGFSAEVANLELSSSADRIGTDRTLFGEASAIRTGGASGERTAGEATGVRSASAVVPDAQATKHKDAKVLGTTYYLSPEALKGEVCMKSDMWALGVITYMLLSGRPPFDGRNDDEIFKAIARGNVDLESVPFPYVTAPAKDFIMRCMTKNVDERISAADAIKHPWFHLLRPVVVDPRRAENPSTADGLEVFANGSLDSVMPQEIFEQLKAFDKKSTLTKLCLEVIAHSLSSEEVTDLKKEFQKYDVDCTGVISHDTLLNILKESDFNNLFSEEDLEQIIASMAVEKQPEGISYNEFIAAALSQQMITDSTLRINFERISNRQGYICGKDISNLLGSDGSEEKISEIFKELTLLPSDRINFEQFKSIMRGEFVGYRRATRIGKKLIPTASEETETPVIMPPDEPRGSLLSSPYKRMEKRLTNIAMSSVNVTDPVENVQS